MTLRLAILSDIHADLVPNGSGRRVVERLGEAIAAADSDVFLIPGDLVNHHSLLPEYLAPLAQARINLYVPGNHDVWLSRRAIKRGESSFDALEALAEGCDRSGFHYLPGAPLEIGGWGFAGQLGWYDYSFADPTVGASELMYIQKRYYGRVVWNDAHFAAWRSERPLTDGEVSNLFVTALREDIEALGLTTVGDGPPTVVATHMLPYISLLRFGDALWNFCNAFMGARAIGELYDEFPQTRLVVAGHTHSPREQERDERLVVIAPLGYYATGEVAGDPAHALRFFDLEADGMITSVDPLTAA